MESTSEAGGSFESLFRQHYRRLCSYANTFLKDRESCEDVVQEIFIKVWEKQKMGIGSDKLRFYLFTAVRNNCLTRLKQDRKNFLHELKEEDASYEIKIKLDPVDKMADPKVLISKALDQLPPKCREVFILSRLSDQTYKQIAETLGISVKTVENQMGKAIRILKQFAKENGVYVAMLYFIFSDINIMQTIGVFLENWFY